MGGLTLTRCLSQTSERQLWAATGESDALVVLVAPPARAGHGEAMRRLAGLTGTPLAPAIAEGAVGAWGFAAYRWHRDRSLAEAISASGPPPARVLLRFAADIAKAAKAAGSVGVGFPVPEPAALLLDGPGVVVVPVGASVGTPQLDGEALADWADGLAGAVHDGVFATAARDRRSGPAASWSALAASGPAVPCPAETVLDGGDPTWPDGLSAVQTDSLDGPTLTDLGDGSFPAPLPEVLAEPVERTTPEVEGPAAGDPHEDPSDATESLGVVPGSRRLDPVSGRTPTQSGALVDPVLPWLEAETEMEEVFEQTHAVAVLTAFDFDPMPGEPAAPSVLTPPTVGAQSSSAGARDRTPVGEASIHDSPEPESGLGRFARLRRPREEEIEAAVAAAPTLALERRDERPRPEPLPEPSPEPRRPAEPVAPPTEAAPLGGVSAPQRPIERALGLAVFVLAAAALALVALLWFG